MKVDVIPLQSVLHYRYDLKKGKQVSLPEAVAEELERVSLVKRVAVEGEAEKATAGQAATQSTKTPRAPRKSAASSAVQTSALNAGQSDRAGKDALVDPGSKKPDDSDSPAVPPQVNPDGSSEVPPPIPPGEPTEDKD